MTRKHLNLGVIQRILGQLLMLFSLTMLVPAAVSLAHADGQADLFLDAFGILLATGLLAWLPSRRQHGDLRLRDGFLVVALFWTVIGLAGASIIDGCGSRDASNPGIRSYIYQQNEPITPT